MFALIELNDNVVINLLPFPMCKHADKTDATFDIVVFI